MTSAVIGSRRLGGGTNTGEGDDFIVCDDPHSVREVESDTV